MKAYKLFRVLKTGEITPLFINKQFIIPIGEWLQAESHPTPGYKVRPFWHCTSLPVAPHLTINGRAWYEIEMDDYTEFKRPKSQGGLWFLASKIRVIRRISEMN